MLQHLRLAVPSIVSMLWASGVTALGYALQPQALTAGLLAMGACGFGILIGIMVERERP